MSRKVLTASANMGTGLWTFICRALCEVFGKESKAFRNKQKRVLDLANKRLNAQLEALGPGYSLTEYRVVWFGNLSVTVSALAELGGDSRGVAQNALPSKPKAKVCPRCGSPIDDDMLFCGECGEKLK